MNDMDSLPPPPWGTLAVEQYLITNWNNSTKTPDQQRKMLVAEFLDMESIPLEWAEDWDSLPAGIDPPRAPTTEEVDTILRPYRSDVLRWHAMNLFNDQTCPALLRTHYCTDEEEKTKHDDLMTKWADSDPFESEAWWAVLNNADLFNFGSEWRRVYEILPELAGPLEPEVDDKLRIPRARKAEDLEPFRFDLKTQIAEAKEEAPEAWRDDRDTIIDSLAIGLQKCATRTYLILADEEAFRSGSLYVLYLDGFRNVIREGRMDPEIHDLFGVIGTWMETNAFLEGSAVGEKYRASAELGRELYQLTEEGLADPNQ